MCRRCLGLALPQKNSDLDAHFRLWRHVRFCPHTEAFRLLPAVVILTVISSFANLKIQPLTLGDFVPWLCLFAWLLFGVGLESALSYTNLGYCFCGILIGMIVGEIPGIGVMATMAMLFPLTFHLEPTTALIMLAGVWNGSTYGRSLPQFCSTCSAPLLTPLRVLMGIQWPSGARRDGVVYDNCRLAFWRKCRGHPFDAIHAAHQPVCSQLRRAIGPPIRPKPINLFLISSLK